MLKVILKFIFILFLIGSIVGGVIFYLHSNKETVALVHPIQGPAVQAVYATGTVEPVIMLPVAPRISSRLMEIHTDEGSQVEKDTLLARLEDTDIQKELTEAQVRVDLAQKEYDRLTALVKTGAVSRQSFDQSKTELESAETLVEKVQASLSYMTLLAPDNGTVIRRDGEIGELIPAGEPVFWLAGQEMRIEAEVDEEDIALVKPGQKTLIHADAFPGEVFEGHVKSITPKGDPVARSYRVRITLQPDTKLMIGMTAESNIIIHEKENALLVPTTAVKNNIVWTMKDGSPIRNLVETGAENKHATEILKGLSAEALVIRNPSSDLPEDDNVPTKIVEWALEE